MDDPILAGRACPVSPPIILTMIHDIFHPERNEEALRKYMQRIIIIELVVVIIVMAFVGWSMFEIIKNLSAIIK